MKKPRWLSTLIAENARTDGIWHRPEAIREDRCNWNFLP